MMRSIYGALCVALLLLSSGCSDDDSEETPTEMWVRLRKTTEIRLHTTRVDVDQFELSMGEVVDDVLPVKAFIFGNACVNQDTGVAPAPLAFSADIKVSNPAKIPLGKAIDVGDPEAPIHAKITAITYDPCLTFMGDAEGTVTLSELTMGSSPSASYVRGTFDLRVDEAKSDCAVQVYMPIKMRWTDFEPIEVALCLNVPEE